MKLLLLRRRKGSALIITMLLVTVIATVSFAISALTISEFRKTANLQDSVSAYYVAEGGIEHGLLEYRLWHDAQISEEYYKSLGKGQLSELEKNSPTETFGKPQRFTLDGKTVVKKIGGQDVEVPAAGYVNSNGELGNAWYGLKMWYKDDKIGDVDSSGMPIIGPNSRLLSKDAALQFKVPENAGEAILRWEQVGSSTQRTGLSPFIEYIATNGQELKRDLRFKTGGGIATADTWRIPLSRAELGFQPTELRLKPWDMESIRYSIVFQDSGHNEINLDAQRTYIEATGYSGKAKRQLRIGINRNTGSILESQDFLLYSGDRSIILQ